MLTTPSCSPFSQAVRTSLEYQGSLYLISAIPLDEEVARHRVWEVYLSRFDRSMAFTMSQARRAPYNAVTLQQRVIAFISDGHFPQELS